MPYFLLIVNVFIMTGGQLFFKKSADYINANPQLHFPMSYIANPWFYLAILLYIVSTFIWTQALTKIPLSIAYPIVSLAYILTVLGALFFFQEKVSYLGVLGIVFIMAGVSLTVLK